MFVVPGVGVVLLVVALTGYRLSRPRRETILDHQRALAALREAEQPRSPTAAEARPVLTLTDHVHILDGPPTGMTAPRRYSKASSHRKLSTLPRDAAEISERPTIATLPAAAYVGAPMRWLLAAEPPPVELHPVAPDPADREPDFRGPVEPEPKLLHAFELHLPRPLAGAPVGGRERRRSRVTVWGIVALGCVIALALGAAVAMVVEHRAPKRVVDAPHTQTAPAHDSSIAAAPKPIVHDAPAAPPVAPVTVTVMPVATTASGNGTVVVSAPFTLTLAATGPCWVSVSAISGPTLFEGTLSAGQRQQVAGSRPLVVRLGNSPAMTMTVNGKRLDLSHVARTADVQFVTA